MALCRTQRGSASRSRVLSDHDIAPKSRCPWLKYGSTGLMRGEPSLRIVPSSATPVASNRLCAGSAIVGATDSTSSQRIPKFSPSAKATPAVRGHSETLAQGDWVRKNRQTELGCAA